MQKVASYLTNIHATHGLAPAHERRKALISEMQALEQTTIHCFTCPGTCCTSKANSMQITPIEALEILHSLRAHEWTEGEEEAFKERMRTNIREHRLDVEIYTGKKHSSSLRKTYTCPFFNNGSLGCGLSRSSKPYGCLGFNPKTMEDNGKTCSSNTNLLAERDLGFFSSEEKVNDDMRRDLNLWWNKESIPKALILMLEALKKHQT